MKFQPSIAICLFLATCFALDLDNLKEAAAQNKDKITAIGITGFTSFALCTFSGWSHCGHIGIIGATGGSLAWDAVKNKDEIVEYVSGHDSVQVLKDGLEGLKKTALQAKKQYLDKEEL